jgi:hypothetical protein
MLTDHSPVEADGVKHRRIHPARTGKHTDRGRRIVQRGERDQHGHCVAEGQCLTAEWLAPAGLVATPEAFSVTLTWTQPTGGAEIEGYTIYKNGLRVAEIEADTTTFQGRPRRAREGVLVRDRSEGGQEGQRSRLHHGEHSGSGALGRQSAGDFNVKLATADRVPISDA